MTVIKEIEKIVEQACKKDSNFFGYNIWTHHILNVVKYAKLMAIKYGADEDIVEIAALLHDYASVKDYNLHKDHHIHGAREAKKILTRFNYPLDKIEQIEHCIMSHRGSKLLQKKTKEAVCVADADAMAHFDAVPSLFYFAFIKHNLSIDEATNWLKNKLQRSWNKLSSDGKKMTKQKYEAGKILLDG